MPMISHIPVALRHRGYRGVAVSPGPSMAPMAGAQPLDPGCKGTWDARAQSAPSLAPVTPRRPHNLP
jgi:hypothetical protein